MLIKTLTFAPEMEMKNININWSVGLYSDRLVGFAPAKGSGCDMYFNELKCKW
ncbi:hypothetical protein ACHRVW_19860 [Flavobacterium collinsii]|uniref:hypothetical protein n=1 Tax=Flavobacterium collinsii TaxID=1114861 RepID=UPI0022C72106|nr:hypothetical protein [Flavobacterium collinsii]GIQ57254.1 hypothetical protein Flavo103_03900 [Flavobacterium collinsii]